MIKAKKKQLREEMLNSRKKLTHDIKKAYDRSICDALWQKVSSEGFAIVHTYLPMGEEVDITPMIRKMLSAGICVVAPKTLPRRQLSHLVLHSLEELEKGVFGTSHPAGSEEYQGPYDMIIVPGLAFDLQNFRLGYGGGYYDGFLSQHSKSLKWGIGYPFQMLEKVPSEEHDVQLDRILTPSID